MLWRQGITLPLRYSLVIELYESVLEDCLTGSRQKALIVSQVVDGKQDGAQHLARDEQMTQISAAVITGDTGAILLQRFG